MPDLMTDWGEVESKLRAKGGKLYDPSDLEGIKRNTGYLNNAVDLDTALNNAYQNYDQRASSQRGGDPGPSAPVQYSSSGSSGGGGDAALSSFQSYLQTRDAAAQKQQDALREILMGQLGQASQPVSADSAGIREVIGGQRLALQRGAERQRQGAAELRAYDGSGGLGGKAFSSDVNRIEQGQAESDAMMTGDVLNRELQNKRQQLTQLLAIATQLGDAESARLLQTQLNAIQTQLSQSNFYDTMGYNYAGLNQQGNLQALMAILGAA
jgi:hypothetical protein